MAFAIGVAAEARVNACSECRKAPGIRHEMAASPTNRRGTGRCGSAQTNGGSSIRGGYSLFVGSFSNTALTHEPPEAVRPEVDTVVAAEDVGRCKQIRRRAGDVGMKGQIAPHRMRLLAEVG